MEQNSARVFSEHWSIYQKIILHNYMNHEEFACKVFDLFTKLPEKNLHILDIGCGDAATLLPVLQQFPVSSYTGYDLSSPPLQLAAAHLMHHNFSPVLKQGNMMALIQEEEKQFDIIHSSFAIHHLQDNEKEKLLQACFCRLYPGGKMIYTDVFRQQHISRDQYIEEYFSYIKNEWLLLATYEKELVSEHVRQYDFPSRLEETIGWSELAGFSVLARYRPDHLHAMLVLTKPKRDE
ncbi:MAG: class I SAM-dependent methyltransferase [Ginsengibacter sp.]